VVAPLGSEPVDSVLVTYEGDANHLPGWQNELIAVTQRSSQTTVNCASPTVNVGMTLTCTVTVADPDPGTATMPSGSAVISSTDGSTTPCNLTTGTCSITYQPALGSEGTQTLTAAYQGDADHQASQATTTVSVIPDSTTLVPAPLEAVPSDPLFSATLSDNVTGGPLSGQVIVFTAGSGTYCSAVTDSTGTASCRASDNAVAAAKASGGYDAHFSGTNDYVGSTAIASLKASPATKTHGGS
jgi:hypothetical protein